MILEILVGAQVVGFLVGVPLLQRYLVERVSNLAREQTELALANHRHEHERALASISASHQKSVAEFGLYARKQHKIYSALYKRIREAADRYGWFYRITYGADYSKYTPEDVEAYRETNRLRARNIESPMKLAVAGDQDGLRKAMNELEQKVRARDANIAFTRAKNIEALYQLYLSDDVQIALETVRRAMATVAVAAERDPDDRDAKGLEKHEALDKAIAGLYTVMRKELRRGGEA